MLRLSVKYPFLQFMKHFKALSFISNVIYEAMTATFFPLYRESLISNSLISKGLNIMSPIGTAGATKICPLYRISLRSRVTISRIDCIYY